MEVRLTRELAEKFSPSDLFKPWALKPLIIAVSLMILQQLSGINAAVYNSVVIKITLLNHAEKVITHYLLFSFS